jgi:hypothetical protein
LAVEREEPDVSGIADASSAIDAGGAVSGPLTLGFSWTGSVPLNVSGASGVPSAVLFVYVSGGTPPYSGGFSLLNNTSGKLYLTASPDGIHTTVGWSGFSLNELESANAHFEVTDSAGASQSGTAGVAFKRTS